MEIFKNEILVNHNQLSSNNIKISSKLKSKTDCINKIKKNKSLSNENTFKNNLKKKSNYLFFQKKVNINFDYLKEKNFKTLKTYRKIIGREKRKKLLKKYLILRLLWNCTSKIKLMQIFEQINSKWKKFIKFYLGRCLIFHLSIRQLKNVSEIMRHRQNLYDSIENPQLLINQFNFTNNLIKNFCKGISNSVIMFYDDLIKNKMIPIVSSSLN